MYVIGKHLDEIKIKGMMRIIFTIVTIERKKLIIVKSGVFVSYYTFYSLQQKKGYE